MFPSPSVLVVLACADVCPASPGLLWGPLSLSHWSLLWLVIPWVRTRMCRAVLCVRDSPSPTPPVPALLLPADLSAKLLPAVLPQNNLFCCLDSPGLEGKPSVLKRASLYSL